MHKLFWLEKVKGRELARSWRRWEGNVRMDFRGTGGEMWAGFIWLRIETSCGLL
jgi:hypothetical protein